MFCGELRPSSHLQDSLGGIARDKVDGLVAVVRNAGPVAVTPVGLLAIRWMGLWPSSAMVVAPELLERKCQIR